MRVNSYMIHKWNFIVEVGGLMGMTEKIASYLLEGLFLKVAGQSRIMRSIEMILAVGKSISIKHRR